MLDFPSNPQPGDTYTSGGATWTWDGAKWTPGGPGGAFLPISGGTLTGPLILAADPAAVLGAATKQYVDGGDAERLALAGGVMTGPLTLAQDPVGPLDSATKEYVDSAVTSWFGTAMFSGFVNKLRNPSMDIWQRGASFTIAANGAAYTADGWVVSSSGAASTVKPMQVGAGSRGRVFNALQVTGAAAVTDVAIYQRIESSLAAQLYTGTDAAAVTVSALVYNGGPAAVAPSLSLNFPTSGAADNWASGGTAYVTATLQSCPAGAWTRVAYTFAAPPVNIQNGLSVYFDFLNMASAAGATVWFTWPDIRVTPGWTVGLCANPPPPEIRPMPLEYAFCQRYYQYGNGYGGGIFFGGSVTSGSGYWGQRPFYVPMRVSPTAALVNNGASSFPATSGSVNYISNQGVQESRVASATAVAGWYSSNYTMNADL